MIAPIVNSRLQEVEELCRRFGVRRLELFGSGATGKFDPSSSDLDFAVEFEAGSELGPADRYFGLLWALEELFGCPIDLIESSQIRNPYLLQSIQESRTELYAA